MRASKARKLRRLIEALADHLEDWEALEAPELFRKWDGGEQYRKDQRVRCQGILYRCLRDHWSQPGEEPGGKSGLWARVRSDSIPAEEMGGCPGFTDRR